MPRPVKLVEVTTSLDQHSRTYPAIIQAADRTELSFQVEGQIELLPIKEGDLVAQGDLIAQLDQRQFINDVNSTRAQYDNAEEEYQRALRLVQEDAIAQSVLEQRKSQRDVAKAAYDNAQKALSDTTIRAPFDGQIANLNFRRLQHIQSGSTLSTFISSHDLEARINIPSSAIAGISRNAAEHTEQLNAELRFEALPNMTFPAHFKEAEAIANTSTQTFKVAFLFERPSDVLILPGMNASLTITNFPTAVNDTSVDGVNVPLSAIFDEDNNYFVWVYNSDTMSVSKRNVDLLEGFGDTLVATRGLRPGEQIVAAGTSYLADGMAVRPWVQ